MKKYARTPKATIEEFIKEHLDDVCETIDDAVYFYDFLMIKASHDKKFGNEEFFFTKEEYDLSLKRAISWLKVKCWNYVRECFRKKFGVVPDCIENKTYLKADEVKNIQESVEDTDNVNISETTKIHDKLIYAYNILSSVDKNVSLLMCDMLKETMQKR